MFELLIRYRDTMGKEMAPDFKESFSAGEMYNIQSPQIDGYKCSKDSVKGKMPRRNVQVSVYYAPTNPSIIIDDAEEPLL